MDGRGQHLKFAQKTKLATLRTLVREGERSLEIICKRTGWKPSTVIAKAEEHHIRLPELFPYRYRPGIDTLVTGEFTEQAIGERNGGISREAVRQYLVDSRTHTEFMQKRAVYEGRIRREQQQLREFYSQILFSLKYYVIHLAQHDPAEKAAAQIYAQGELKRIPLKDLVRFFRRHYKALERSQRVSIDKLTEKSSFHHTTARKALVIAQVPPLYGSKEFHATPPETLRAVKRAFSTQLSASDISYFLGISPEVTRRYFRMQGERKVRLPLKRMSRDEGDVTYRLASQIYEAYDVGFTIGESVELLDSSERKVRWALEYRDKVEPVLVRTLQKMFRDKEITTPYLT